MTYPINYPTPQGANVQIFQAPRLYNSTPANHQTNASWIKPKGASFVFFTLIGGGGGGAGFDATDTGGGGGSGAVTNFMCPAFLIPDQLAVIVGVGGAGGAFAANGLAGRESSIYYDVKAKEAYVLLTAQPGSFGSVGFNGGGGGAAMAANNFTAMGFLNSTAGGAGSTTSNTTFLQGGGVSTTSYGYNNNAGGPGFFQMQPIIVGIGGYGNGTTRSRVGGIGCGGGGGDSASNDGGKGGDGLVVIITW
jgi:hypothetical protein